MDKNPMSFYNSIPLYANRPVILILNHSSYFLNELPVLEEYLLWSGIKDKHLSDRTIVNKISIVCHIDDKEYSKLFTLSDCVFERLAQRSELFGSLVQLREDEDDCICIHIPDSICNAILYNMRNHPFVQVAKAYEIIIGTFFGYLRLMNIDDGRIARYYIPNIDNREISYTPYSPNRFLNHKGEIVRRFDLDDEESAIHPKGGYYPIGFEYGDGGDLTEENFMVLFSPGDYFRWFYYIAEYMGDDITLKYISHHFIINPIFECTPVFERTRSNEYKIASFYRSILPYMSVNQLKYLNGIMKNSMSIQFQIHLYNIKSLQDRIDIDIIIRKEVSDEVWEYLFAT